MNENYEIIHLGWRLYCNSFRVLATTTTKKGTITTNTKQISFFQVWIFQWSKVKAFHTFAKWFVNNSLMGNIFAILSKIHIFIRFTGLLVEFLFEKMHMWFEFSMRPAWKLQKSRTCCLFSLNFYVHSLKCGYSKNVFQIWNSKFPDQRKKFQLALDKFKFPPYQKSVLL